MHDRTGRISALLTSLCLVVAGCAGGEQVASTSGTVRTSIVPASVPYYLDLCGQAKDEPAYRLVAPAALARWMAEADPRDRKACAARKRIANGDPITIRLHRVGIGGLSTFTTNGRCIKGCKRDIAIVLDFNGSEALQKPIVAFYQRNVPPDGNLQFLNQTIFTQNEWFARYPPSFRVRLYDVRDDKDQALKANLETIRKATGIVSGYIAGLSVAGPIVDTAVSAAEQLISGPRNRAILDMSFQLFPEVAGKDEGAKPSDADKKARAAAQVKALALLSADALSPAEVARLQAKLGLPERGRDGKLGPVTERALRAKVGPVDVAPTGSAAYNRTARAFLKGETLQPAPIDRTFGPPLYASQLIVFNENAPGVLAERYGDRRWPCGAVPTGGLPSRPTMKRQQLGEPLPEFFYIPDGVRYGGARVYAGERGNRCMLESPFVIFSISRDDASVAADVAQRISELQAKFSAQRAVSEDAVASLGSAMVDSQLALTIDRMENLQTAAALRTMVAKLRALTDEAQPAGGTDTKVHPLPSASYRYRAYRLIRTYLGCTVTDDFDSAGLGGIVTGLSDPAWLIRARNDEVEVPYLLTPDERAAKTTFVCPALPPPPAAPATPPPVPVPAPAAGE